MGYIYIINPWCLNPLPFPSPSQTTQLYDVPILAPPTARRAAVHRSLTVFLPQKNEENGEFV